MRRCFIIFLLLLTFQCLNALEGKKIIILHTNDLHSHLVGFAPESDYSPLVVNNDSTSGGFARIASIIASVRAGNTGTTLVVDDGDFLMGTLFHSMETETGFQLRLMKKMGYDITCFGNHEFDFGPDGLAKIINSSVNKGAIPELLTGNIVFNNENTKDDGLENLYNEGIIKRSYVMDRDGLRIGFFSLIGKDAAEDAPNAAPLKFSKKIKYARKMVKDLKNDHCDVIICLSHSGLEKEKNGQWGGEDVALAQKVKGINVIISGHTHTRLDQPLIVNGVVVVQTGAFGKYVGKLTLEYSKGKVIFEDYGLIPVDDKIAGDPDVNNSINGEKKIISETILKPLGMRYDTKIAETGFKLKGIEDGSVEQSNLGPLEADAIQYYVNKHSERGTDISMVAAGVIRDAIAPGVQETSDIFRVMSLGSGDDNVPGYPLSRLYVTGKELKNILEILQVAFRSKPDNYCYYSGLNIYYNPDKGFLRKIRKIEILKPGGKTVDVDFSRKNKTLYSVTANSYMLQFIGIIKKMSFGLINVVPKNSEGIKVTDMKTAVIDMDRNKEGIQEGKEWLALVEYLSSMKDTNNDGIPDIDVKYSKPVSCLVPVK
jgi:5'-nucleotidase/UDP-sugar diphosphatase